MLRYQLLTIQLTNVNTQIHYANNTTSKQPINNKPTITNTKAKKSFTNQNQTKHYQTFKPIISNSNTGYPKQANQHQLHTKQIKHSKIKSTTTNKSQQPTT